MDYASDNMGKRLTFLKDKLKLTIRKISQDTEVPRSTVADLMNGVKTTNYELLEYLAFYFNCKWLKAYKSREYPEYKDEKLSIVTFEWVTLGHNDTINRKTKEIEDLKTEMFITGLKDGR